MTSVPVLAVLLVGLGVGLAAASWLRKANQQTQDPSVDLEIADLETRRDELIEALRAGASGAERELLEEKAARALKDLEHARSKVQASRPEVDHSGVAPRPAESTSSSLFRHQGLVGFFFGGSVVGLVALLLFWAQRDATPRPDEPTMSAPPPAATADRPHGDRPPLPPELATRIEALEAALEQTPDDIASRKEVALTLMNNGFLFPAFEHSQKILELQPEDPDGLFIQAVVRFAMGNLDQTIELLDRVVSRYPTHVRAFAIRGLAFLRRGDRDAAVASWEAGLEGAGGSHPDLEDLLAKANAGMSAEEILGQPAHPGGAPAAPQPHPQTSGDRYSILIEGPQQQPPAGAVVFVSLRPQAGGPPVAAKKVSFPTFPLRVELSQADSMLGNPLPDTGKIVARLDLDGSASTRDETELAAESTATLGQPLTLRLQ